MKTLISVVDQALEFACTMRLLCCTEQWIIHCLQVRVITQGVIAPGWFKPLLVQGSGLSILRFSDRSSECNTQISQTPFWLVKHMLLFVLTSDQGSFAPKFEGDIDENEDRRFGSNSKKVSTPRL